MAQNLSCARIIEPSEILPSRLKATRLVPSREKLIGGARGKRGKKATTLKHACAFNLSGRLQPVSKLEYADEDRVDKLLKSPLLDQKDRALLSCYKKQRKKNNQFEVKYDYKQPLQFGRLYVDDGERRMVGHQTLPKNVRKYITRGYYVEIDVVNCQPTIIRFLFEALDMKCPPDLERYVAERATVLSENGIIDKKIVIKYLNKKKDDAPYPFLRNIHKEIYGDLVPRLQQSMEFGSLWQWISESGKKYNKEGSFLSNVVFTVENAVLGVMHEYFTARGFKADALIFDGILVKEDARINDELLHECERFIEERVGIHLRLARKAMESEIDYDREIVVDPGNIIVDDDKELSALIEQARSGTSGRLALLAMYLMKDKYLCFGRKNWYKFGPHKWREISGCPSMDAMHILIDPIRRWYDIYISELGRISVETDDTAVRQYVENTIEKVEKEKKVRIEAIEDATVRIKVMKDLEDLLDAYTRNITFDSKPYLLCFENGVYDLLNDAMRPGLPQDYLSMGVPYSLPDAADAEIDAKLDALLESIFPDVDLREYVLSTLCTCLEGLNRHEQYWTWQGSGRNGKGILKDLVQHTLGEELCKFPKVTILTTKRCHSGQANPEFVDLKGARAVFVSEPCVGEKIRTATLRELTGNDKTRQRGLYGAQETVRPDFSLFLLCNGRPEMDAPDTDAIWDRERGVHFPHKFVEKPTLPHEKKIDKALKQKLQEYAPYFMLKLLRHYKRYRENEWTLDPPKRVLQISKDYRLENNPVEKFYEEQVVKATEDGRKEEDGAIHDDKKKDTRIVLPVCRIWSAFEKWRKDTEVATIVTENGFYQKLAKLAKGNFPKVKIRVDGAAPSYCYEGMLFRDYKWNRGDCCWELKQDGNVPL